MQAPSILGHRQQRTTSLTASPNIAFPAPTGSLVHFPAGPRSVGHRHCIHPELPARQLLCRRRRAEPRVRGHHPSHALFFHLFFTLLCLYVRAVSLTQRPSPRLHVLARSSDAAKCKKTTARPRLQRRHHGYDLSSLELASSNIPPLAPYRICHSALRCCTPLQTYEGSKWFPNFFSLESSLFPGRFIRHQGYRLKVHEFEDTQLFKADAAFQLKPVAGTETSLKMDQCYKLFAQNFKQHSWSRRSRADADQDDTFKFVPALDGTKDAVSIESCDTEGNLLPPSPLPTTPNPRSAQSRSQAWPTLTWLGGVEAPFCPLIGLGRLLVAALPPVLTPSASSRAAQALTSPSSYPTPSP